MTEFLYLFSAVPQTAEQTLIVLAQVRRRLPYFQSLFVQAEGQQHCVDGAAIVQFKWCQAAGGFQVGVFQQIVRRSDGGVRQCIFFKYIAEVLC